MALKFSTMSPAVYVPGVLQTSNDWIKSFISSVVRSEVKYREARSSCRTVTARLYQDLHSCKSMGAGMMRRAAQKAILFIFSVRSAPRGGASSKSLMTRPFGAMERGLARSGKFAVHATLSCERVRQGENWVVSSGPELPAGSSQGHGSASGTPACAGYGRRACNLQIPARFGQVNNADEQGLQPAGGHQCRCRKVHVAHVPAASSSLGRRSCRKQKREQQRGFKVQGADSLWDPTKRDSTGVRRVAIRIRGRTSLLHNGVSAVEGIVGE